jgi:hypothetical protein
VDTTIEKIERLNLLLLIPGAILVGVTGWLHAPSFLAGGAVMQLNFWLLKRLVRSLIVPTVLQDKKGRRRAAVLFSGKVLLSLLLLSGLVWRYPMQAWSFMAGVSLLLVTCMIVTLLESPTGAQVEDNNA